jgi:hypothetical protein
MKSPGRAAARTGAGVVSGGIHADGEGGSLTLMLLALFIALLALAGIVVDGGSKLDQAENAAAYAQEAARAGAGMVNQGHAYATGTFTVDRGQAIAAARQYLATAGAPGTVAPAGANSITVTVTLTEPTKWLSMIGIDSMTSTATATASLVSGVTGPGQ